MSSTVTFTNKTLTEEQLKRIEENRLKALQIKKQFNNTNNTTNISTINSNNLNFTKKIEPPKQSEMLITGKCLYSNDEPETRFEVHVGYHKGLIDLFKTIKTKKYEPTTKRWSFSLDNHDELIHRVQRELGGVVKLEPLDRVASSKIKHCKFFLIDRNRFECQADYDSELLDLFKLMKTKQYDPYTKKWSFQLKEYDELIKNILAKFKRGGISLSPLPKWVKEVFKDQIEGKLSPRIDPQYDLDHLKTKLDPTITKSLLPFQVEGICFGVQQQGRLLLADDMGLGKTLQGLSIANYYMDEWPLFIVTPSSVKFMWKESAKRWLSNSICTLANIKDPELIDDYIQVIENGRQLIHKDSLIVIASYDLLAKNVDEIVKSNFNVVVCDECHLLKSSKV
jgi:SWI/SNF-related matrix-associated actin-dependent regulator 1 of chromatin subfamily A